MRLHPHFLRAGKAGDERHAQGNLADLLAALLELVVENDAAAINADIADREARLFV